MSRHTTSRVGGPADWFVEARSAADLCEVVLAARKMRAPHWVLGGGSNILVADAGIRGLVILNKAKQIQFRDMPGSSVWAESGVVLPTLARECTERGLANLEWAIGVPGTVGGAVAGNAGAHGADIAQSLLSATILDDEDSVREWSARELEFGYRTSKLKAHRGRG